MNRLRRGWAKNKDMFRESRRWLESGILIKVLGGNFGIPEGWNVLLSRRGPRRPPSAHLDMGNSCYPNSVGAGGGRSGTLPYPPSDWGLQVRVLSPPQSTQGRAMSLTSLTPPMGPSKQHPHRRSYPGYPQVILSQCTEQEQKGLFGQFRQSSMESLSAMTVVSSAMSRQVMRCNKKTLRRGPEHSKSQVWTLG